MRLQLKALESNLYRYTSGLLMEMDTLILPLSNGAWIRMPSPTAVLKSIFLCAWPSSSCQTSRNSPLEGCDMLNGLMITHVAAMTDTSKIQYDCQTGSFRYCPIPQNPEMPSKTLIFSGDTIFCSTSKTINCSIHSTRDVQGFSWNQLDIGAPLSFKCSHTIHAFNSRLAIMRKTIHANRKLHWVLQ